MSWGKVITILVIFQKSRLKLRYALIRVKAIGGDLAFFGRFFSLNILVSKFYVLLHAFYGIQKYSAIGSKMPETCGCVRVISGHFGPFLDPWWKLILRLDVKIDQMERVYGVL